MKTYPLESLNLEEAKELQFKLVEIISHHFTGTEFLCPGDVGVAPGLGRPRTTAKVEEVIAEFLEAEAAALVRGAGTGSIRFALQALLKPQDKILVHDAPIYSTTGTTFEAMGLNIVKADMNNTKEVLDALTSDIKMVYIQHSRQRISDKYDMYELIKALRRVSHVPIVTDENYAVLKTRYIGTQVGANASCFSLFKLLGPEGIGCVVGDKKVIGRIREINYSGGGQVQGPEAMEALRAMVYVPVSLAIQSEEIEKMVKAINDGEIPGAKAAYIANAQSRTVLVELQEPISQKVIEETDKLGAASYPVGAESRYEITPMFYRLSGTFIKDDPKLKDYVIRVNPMRAGSATVLRILKQAIAKAR